jgi:hypothetical protein
MAIEGIKELKNKLKYSLLPLDTLEEVIRVLEYGAKKYEAQNWRYVNPRAEIYFEAMMRHAVARYYRGEHNDPESGLLHTAHMATNALFLLNAELEGNGEVFTPTDKLMVSGQKLSIAEIACPVEEK